jgi:hypothetical protein
MMEECGIAVPSGEYWNNGEIHKSNIPSFHSSIITGIA